MFPPGQTNEDLGFLPLLVACVVVLFLGRLERILTSSFPVTEVAKALSVSLPS